VEPIIFISDKGIIFVLIVFLLISVGFVYFLIKIFGKYNYYLLLIVFLLSLYWWFGYREMSIVEDYETANYYKNLSQEDVNNLDYVTRILWVASYYGNESKFVDSLRLIICEDITNLQLERHNTYINKLYFFVGRNSHNAFHKSHDSADMRTFWNATDSTSIILYRGVGKEIIPLDCDEWKEGSRSAD
jgi:hypothetical protein